MFFQWDSLCRFMWLGDPARRANPVPNSTSCGWRLILLFGILLARSFLV